MPVKALLACVLGLLLVATMPPAQAAAQPAATGEAAVVWRLAAAGISASEAAAMVQRRVGGRILAVETVQGRDGVYYRIKVLTRSGEVRVYRVDAGTGHMQ